jgi:hypothetical protein
VSDLSNGGDRIAGAALMSAAAATILAMAHHPTSAHSGLLGPIVHGVMIALVALMTFGFAHLSIRRGLARPAMLAGLVAWGIAAFGHIGAATINGFVVPALASRVHGAPNHDLFHIPWQMNQALAQLGVVAAGAAYLFWSIDFLRRAGTEARLIGLLGLAAAVVPVVLLVGGWLEMNVAGALTVYTVQVAWAALVGLHLVRGGLAQEAAAGLP